MPIELISIYIPLKTDCMPIERAKICFISNNHVSIMKHSVSLSASSSMSFILSLSEYLQNTIKLKPPNLKHYLADKSPSQLQIHLLSPQSCDYFEAWADYLFQLLTKEKILKSNNEILFVTSVEEQYFRDNLSNNSQFQIQELIKLDKFDIKSHAKDSLRQENLAEIPKYGKKISIINFSASVANLDKLKPKIHLDGLYAGQFYKFGDKWQSFKILKSQIPTVDEINRQDVLILTGSTYSVNNMCPQMKKFGNNLFKSLALNKHLRIIGTCFGHQFLAHLHGASVNKRNFVKGPQKVRFSQQKQSMEASFLDNIMKTQTESYKLYEYHNDHVCEVPRGFKKVGESDSCEIESLLSIDKRIWTCQFHPQYSKQYIKKYQQRSAAYEGQQYHPQENKTDKLHQTSNETLRVAIRKFIDWII